MIGFVEFMPKGLSNEKYWGPGNQSRNYSSGFQFRKISTTVECELYVTFKILIIFT